MTPYQQAVPFVSAIVSICSLLVAIVLAWRTRLAPPRLVGGLPYILDWKLYARENSDVHEHYLLPRLWLTNIGANPMLVQDLRLTLNAPGKEAVTIYPTHTVPVEVVQASETISNPDELRLGLAPFGGFAIAPAANWESNLAFIVPSEKAEPFLRSGIVAVSVEVKQQDSRKFKRVLTQRINFASEFDWLDWAGSDSSQYYYAQFFEERKTR